MNFLPPSACGQKRSTGSSLKQNLIFTNETDRSAQRFVSLSPYYLLGAVLATEAPALRRDHLAKALLPLHEIGASPRLRKRSQLDGSPRHLAYRCCGSSPSPPSAPPPPGAAWPVPRPSCLAPSWLSPPPEQGAKLKAQDGVGEPLQPAGARAGEMPGLRGEVRHRRGFLPSDERDLRSKS